VAHHEHLVHERGIEVDRPFLRLGAARQREGAHRGEREQEGTAGGAKQGKACEQSSLLGCDVFVVKGQQPSILL
jgi:hypothetical protein